MREINSKEKLEYFLTTYQLDGIFGPNLLPHLSLYSFSQGEIICSQGDPLETVYVLVQGKVKIYTTSAEGKTLILSFKTPLEVIGDIEFIQEIYINNTVEAISPVYMIGVDRRVLKQYGQDYLPFLHFLLKIITRKFNVKTQSLRSNVMYPVEVRLASYLLSMIAEDTKLLEEVELSTTSLKDMANLIGTSYRHLNRVIQQFCEKGLLERKRGTLVIKNLEGLNELVRTNIYEK